MLSKIGRGRSRTAISVTGSDLVKSGGVGERAVMTPLKITCIRGSQEEAFGRNDTWCSTTIFTLCVVQLVKHYDSTVSNALLLVQAASQARAERLLSRGRYDLLIWSTVSSTAAAH